MKSFKKNFHKVSMSALVLLGMLQMTGYAAGLSALRGIGFLSAASPLPLVFSHFRGFETFALDFEVEIAGMDGTIVKQKVIPELYSGLSGPYNRRNVFGAVFAYGPGFQSEDEIRLRDSVLRYGFCDPGVLLDEFSLPSPAAGMTAHLKSRTKGDPRSWEFSVNCRK
ncbi:MAG: hypothetical protein OEZ34_16600 [Spirochaetia bacterium]|nr:hypothetical protein [Spirochaetia bacterium]